MSEANQAVQDQPRGSPSAQSFATSREGCLCISFQTNLTSVFQISTDTSLDDKDNPTCSGDLVTKEGPIVIDKDYEFNMKKQFAEQVVEMVTDHQLRNNIQKLYVVYYKNIPYMRREDTGEMTESAYHIDDIGEQLLGHLKNRMARLGRSIQQYQSVEERELYADIAFYSKGQSKTRHAVLRCSKEASYVICYHGSQNKSNIDEDVEKNKVHSKVDTFLATDFRPPCSCISLFPVHIKPFTVLIVGKYEIVEERQDLVKKAEKKNQRREAGDISWNQFKGRYMGNPAFAAGVHYFYLITRDELRRHYLFTLSEFENYTDPPPDVLPVGSV